MKLLTDLVLAGSDAPTPYGRIERGALVLEGDQIVYAGTQADLPEQYVSLKATSLEGRLVTPGLIDCHTHLVHGGSRAREFEMRQSGASYADIAKAGGGIVSTVAATREASEDALIEQALVRLDRLIADGVTTVEIKSGYGLTLDAERKMLRVIKRLKEAVPIPIKATFLGCHAVPAEFEDAAAYTKHVVEEMLPTFARDGLIDYVDAFCEKGYFGVDETRALLIASNALGIKGKVHVNQFNEIGGINLCINQKALSVDHLEVCGAEVIQRLVEDYKGIEKGKGHPTYPVALPGCSHFLGIPFAPGRALIDAGLPLALATDHNPGSAPSGDMTMVVRLASLKMNLLPREAIAAATLNGAAAMELSYEVGAIGRGHRANLILSHPMEGLQHMAYRFTDAVVDKVFVNGEIWEGGMRQSWTCGALLWCHATLDRMRPQHQ